MTDVLLGIGLYTVFGLLPSAACGWYWWQCWSGKRRAWAAAGPAFGQFTNGKNYLPMVFGPIALFILLMVTGILIEVFLPLVGTIVQLVGIIPTFFVVCSWFWWPRFLTPAWHKDWVARSGTASTPLYTDRFPDTTRPKKRQRATGISLKNRSQP